MTNVGQIKKAGSSMKRKFNIINSWPYLFDHLLDSFAQTDTNTEAITNIFFKNHQRKESRLTQLTIFICSWVSEVFVFEG